MGRMQIELLQCSNGHFYKSSSPVCPFCSGKDGGVQSFVSPEPSPSAAPIPETVPVTTPFAEAFTPDDSAFQTTPQFDVEEYGQTMPMPMAGEVQQCDAVVGWLVGITGPNRGQAYRLHSGTNFIGRGTNMDVCILHDNTLTSDKAASISYDDRSRVFFLERGNGRNNIYRNGVVVRDAVDLARMDRLVFGNSEFLFVPLCGEQFQWKDL